MAEKLYDIFKEPDECGLYSAYFGYNKRKKKRRATKSKNKRRY